jgi:hypothetical protein
MVHKERIKITKKGLHKISIHKSGGAFETAFNKFKSEGNVYPSRNQDAFWKEVMENASDLKKQFDDKEITEEELRDKLEDLAQGMLDDDSSEPEATVFYDDSDEPHVISEYTDDTEGDFDVKWHSSDAWRGWYEVSSKKWKNIHTDTALSYSEDESELKEFDEKLQSELKGRSIPFARVFSRTSNVFSTSYDFFVKKDDVPKVEHLVKTLAEKHRDPERFTSTALTGADPSEQTPEDKLFVAGAKRIMGGESATTVMKDIIKKKKEE